MSMPDAMIRREFIITGQVQGVGFRPFVFRIATEHSLTGTVSNTSDGVFIEVQGPAGQVAAFGQALTNELPPLAEVISRTEKELPVIEEEEDFVIVASTGDHGNSVLISPDVATCDDCLRDIFAPHNPRYLYPFTNCTNCGPRYTITRSIPYDRKTTSMACFALCEACRTEYEDPLDRRFHAQPNACPACGPQVWLASPGGMRLCRGTEAIRQCAKALSRDALAAIKGLGGFHLVCDATSERAVRLLRHRKQRPGKPLAIMVPDLATAEAIASVSEHEARALCSKERPIVLLAAKAGSPVVKDVYPQTNQIGIMLPYTPLHHVLLELYTELLAQDGLPALVMTSGNMSSEPICLGNREALQRLDGIADVFLLHDRDILIRTDDSVVRVDRDSGEYQFMRRARGFTPRPLYFASENGSLQPDLPVLPAIMDDEAALVAAVAPTLPDDLLTEMTSDTDAIEAAVDADAIDWDDFPDYSEPALPQDQEETAVVGMPVDSAQEDTEFAKYRLESIDAEEGDSDTVSVRSDIDAQALCVLGAGPELKNTLCITRGEQAFVSQHIGDLQNLETFTFFQEIATHLPAILEVKPDAVVRDLHPDYMTTGFAAEYAQVNGIPLFTLQHHYAHIYSVLAENQYEGPALGLALDGTGYGEDGSIWGGELLFVDTLSLEQERLGHFSYIPLPGGETAIREPWRIAQGLLWMLDIKEPSSKDWTWLAEHAEASAMLPVLMEKQVNTPMTSSCGRLFDAVSALLGICHTVTYEGQAAMMLEAAQDMDVTEPYACPLLADVQPARLDTHTLFLQVYDDWKSGVPVPAIARRFHLGLMHGIGELVYGIGMVMGVENVGLSGGVMQNATLAAELPRLLRQMGLNPLVHSKLPPNDGCISFGQAYYGRQKILREAE